MRTVQATSSRCCSLKHESISTTILERARQGDGLAFSRIVDLYGGLVYHWCRQSGLSPEDTQDVGQQVFVSVLRCLKNFRRNKPRDSFRGWIRVITRSRIADHFRGNQGEPTDYVSKRPYELAQLVDDDTLGGIHEDKIILFEQAVRLMQTEFSDQDCEAFWGVVIDGIPAKDVSQNLEMSVNSVYIAKSRILRRLRIEFDGLLDD